MSGPIKAQIRIDFDPVEDARLSRMLIGAPALLDACQAVRDSLRRRVATEGPGGIEYAYELQLLDAALARVSGQPSFAAGNDPKDHTPVQGLPPALTTRLDKVPCPLFAVIEYSSFFAVRHLPTGAEVPMGDGVDALFREGEEGLEPITPGTEGFVQEWEESFNANPQETLEAYFPELVGQEDGGPPVQNQPSWPPGPDDPPLWMDAVNTPTAMLSACKTFLACPPAERGSPVLEELFRAVVRQAEQQRPQQEES